jgi:hypothetical protein
MTAAKKTDTLGRAIGKRKNNGPEDRGLSEASIFFRLPQELKDAMAERAEAQGQSISTVWRQAAEWYLISDKRVSPAPELLKHFLKK